MNIRNSFLVFLCIFCVAQPCALLAVQKSLPASSFERLNYSFAGKEFEEPYWGMTKGDLNGDGVKQWVLLARNSIVVGDFENEKFVSAAQCSWKGDAQGGRVYAYDIDGDGDDEIIISAVSFAKPASVILNFKNGRCEELMTNIPYSLRVVKGKEGFIGQSWSSSDYFFGKIFKLGVEKNKLKRAGSMVLPWLTYLYDFDIFETADEGLYCILQKGIDYLELRKKTGRKFKRMWRSPDKFGGSINQIFAPSRAVLGSDTGEFVTFPTAPVYLATGENLRVIAIHHDMPVKGIIGLKTFIRGSEAVIFRFDWALGFIEEARTDFLPGAAVDMYIDEGGDGAFSIYILTVSGGGFLGQATGSRIFRFDRKSTPPGK